MNKTENYQLSLWDKTDRIMMADFNEDNGKIDAALANKADKTTVNSDVSSLQSQINTKTGIVVGRYSGNGSQTRTISLGFAPKAVIVCRSDGWFSTNSYSYGGIAASGASIVYNSQTSLAVTSNGFTVGNISGGTGWGAYLNESNYTYHYIAFQ